jgi:hypothetical protein
MRSDIGGLSVYPARRMPAVKHSSFDGARVPTPAETEMRERMNGGA